MARASLFAAALLLQSWSCFGFTQGFSPARGFHARQRVRVASSLGSTTTELPDSFDDAIVNAVESTTRALEDGWTQLRVDFDTSAGDMTYTQLKNSIPMCQKFVSQLSGYILERAGGGASAREEGGKEEEKTIRIYFPDAGSAAMCMRDWKVGTPDALVPSCVRFASLNRDLPEDSDEALVMLCPKASEVDSLKLVLEKMETRSEVPIIYINPELVNMGTTGYGMGE